MTTVEKKIQNLPPDVQNEVIDYLLEKKVKHSMGKWPFGLSKGHIKIGR